MLQRKFKNLKVLKFEKTQNKKTIKARYNWLSHLLLSNINTYIQNNYKYNNKKTAETT